MDNYWKPIPLDENQRVKFAKLIERGWSVKAYAMNGNTKVTVTRPRSQQQRRRSVRSSEDLRERDRT